MIGSLASILLSILLGCLLVYRFAGLTMLRPRWAGWLLIFGAGTALGIALTSCLFFILSLIGVPHLALWIRLALLAAAGYACWRNPQPPGLPEPGPRYAYAPLLWIVFAAALLFLTYGMSAAWDATPHGIWDAWAIWNLRAKFLAAGDGLISRAWSPKLDFTHPEYPLLLSSFIASSWMDGGSLAPEAPIATSYLFFLALLFMVTGGVAVLRGPILGLLAGICLMGIPRLLAEVPSQYSDIPLACFLAGAVLFAVLDRPVVSGMMAGSAAWTKDEGLVFLIVLIAAVALLKRRNLLRTCYGAAPVAALALIFKLVIARETHSMVYHAQSSLSQKLFDFSRYQTIGSAMGKEIFTWNAGWYHPLLPLAILLAAFRIDRRYFRDTLFCAAVTFTLLLGYFGFYVITPADLQWHISSSLTRLFVQLSPLVLITVFAAMRAPAPAVVAEPIPPKPGLHRKAQR